MNLTALALVGMAVGVAQPVSPSPADYFPMKARSLKLDIEYKPEQRKNIQRVELCVSRAEDAVWRVVDAVTPDKDHFVFTAPEDGRFWLSMRIVFKDGTADPADVTRVPPAMKVLVDSTPPVVRITSAKREGDEIVVAWEIDDKFPSEAATQVAFKPTGPGAIGDWQPVPAASVVKRSARFKPGTAGPVAVQVTAQDLVGNTGSASQEVAAGTQASHTAPAAKPPEVSPAPSGVVVPTETGPLPPPSLANLGGAAPTAPVVPPPVIGSPTPTPPQPSPTPQPAPVVPAHEPPPAPAPFPAADTGPQPIAVGAGFTPPPPAAAPPANVQFINFLRFDLQYQVENGPSGVSRIDLYVTRDDGRTWTKWSQHDGRETPLRVALDTRFNTQPEGDYGFRLVPVSGAGLTDGAPPPGSPPEMRVHVDVTPPMIKVYAPTADPHQRNTLVLHWEATDRNFGRDPILIEWGEQPTGPWKPVAGSEPPTPVLGGQPSAASNRIPNTGSYTWPLPATMTTHRVYLRFTAWDAAGNRSEVTTPTPILVDLTKPRAKIQAIIPGGITPRP